SRYYGVVSSTAVIEICPWISLLGIWAWGWTRSLWSSSSLRSRNAIGSYFRTRCGQTADSSRFALSLTLSKNVYQATHTVLEDDISRGDGDTRQPMHRTANCFASEFRSRVSFESYPWHRHDFVPDLPDYAIRAAASCCWCGIWTRSARGISCR